MARGSSAAAVDGGDGVLRRRALRARRGCGARTRALFGMRGARRAGVSARRGGERGGAIGGRRGDVGRAGHLDDVEEEVLVRGVLGGGRGGGGGARGRGGRGQEGGRAQGDAGLDGARERGRGGVGLRRGDDDIDEERAQRGGEVVRGEGSGPRVAVERAEAGVAVRVRHEVQHGLQEGLDEVRVWRRVVRWRRGRGAVAGDGQAAEGAYRDGAEPGVRARGMEDVGAGE